MGYFVANANFKLDDASSDVNKRKTCEPEMKAILGLMLAAATNGLRSFESYFSVGKDDESLFYGPAFGQYGISKNRALIVIRAATLSPGPQQPAGSDVHWFIDDRLAEFCAHINTVFRSCWISTGDETGPAWHGEEGEGDFDKCPHITVCKRKPEPVCAQFNDVCCAETKVMTFIEFEKAKKYHEGLKYMASVGSYNSAMTVRMCEPIKNCNGVFNGDARFMGVKSAYYNMLIHRVHSSGDVKNNSALSPRKEMQRLVGKKHGDWLVMHSYIYIHEISYELQIFFNRAAPRT